MAPGFVHGGFCGSCFSRGIIIALASGAAPVLTSIQAYQPEPVLLAYTVTKAAIAKSSYALRKWLCYFWR